MGRKLTTGLVLVASIIVFLSPLAVISAAAQSLSIEWVSWDAQITAHTNSGQLEIVETQNISVTGGTLHAGERDFSQQINIQSLSFALNGQSPQVLSAGSGTGQYQMSNANGQIVLQYTLPVAANAGDKFAIVINYTTIEPTAGLIDWNIVPGAHSVPITSSTATIRFPDGQVPNVSQVRIVQGAGIVSADSGGIVVKSQGSVPANQSFEIQIPYGATVSGANPTNANNSNNNPLPTTNPVASDPFASQTGGGIPYTLICGGLCIVGLVVGAIVIFGGGGFLMRMISGLLGGGIGRNGGGGMFGGGGNSGGGGIFGGGGRSSGGGGFSGGGGQSGTGFRDSGNQSRPVPPVGNDKNSGGGGGFS